MIHHPLGQRVGAAAAAHLAGKPPNPTKVLDHRGLVTLYVFLAVGANYCAATIHHNLVKPNQ